MSERWCVKVWRLWGWSRCTTWFETERAATDHLAQFGPYEGRVFGPYRTR